MEGTTPNQAQTNQIEDPVAAPTRDKWIAVEDQLPYNGSEVATKHECGGESHACFVNQTIGFIAYPDSIDTKITHWSSILKIQS